MASRRGARTVAAMATIAPGPRTTGLDRVRDVAIAFIDIVAFTDLSERVPPERLGAVAARLERAAIRAARPPVDFVKLTGDAAMIVGPHAEPVVDAVVELLELAQRDPRLPALHAGIAEGPALRHHGDWLGSPVNVASHLTTIAGPGELLALGPVADQTGARYRWRRLGAREIDGVHGAVELSVLALHGDLRIRRGGRRRSVAS
jgi:adenylate cyclase